MSESKPKLFTADEANKLLTKVEPFVSQLKGLYHSIVKTNKEIDEVIGKLSAGNGYPIRELNDRL